MDRDGSLTDLGGASGDCAGVALLELLVALIVTALVGAITATTISLTVPIWLNQASRAEAATMVSDAADFVLRDLRTAGFNSGEGNVSGIAAAEPDAIELLADLDRDGLLDLSSQERIRYRVGSQGSRLMRVVGNQAMSLLDGLEPGGFRLRYFNASGSEIAGPFPLDSGLLDAIASVEVTIIASGTGRGGPLTVTVVAALRNR